jgi:hypothetical protein
VLAAIVDYPEMARLRIEWLGPEEAFHPENLLHFSVGFLPYNSNQALRAAQVNIEIDDEIVSKESKALSNEVRKFFDCGQLADEDIELALGKINVWNKRLERVKEKAYAIKRNSQCFNLKDPKVSSSENAVANLAQELNNAIDQLKAEDNKRCLRHLLYFNTSIFRYFNILILDISIS